MVAGCNPPAKGVDPGGSASAAETVSVPATASAPASASAASVASAATPAASAPASASASAVASAPAPGPASPPLTEADANKTVDVKAGGTLVLELGANPSTGYDWEVTKAPAALGTPERGYVAGGSSAPGTPGKRVLTWTSKGALPPGEHAVELGYRRSFEAGKPPIKTFTFKVRAAK
ncbi:MAG: protease inhibitor I42 family protein [Deltaproteobacteria bacterium]|nr:protease inhibitor I42 family protein [Deltaproteobacteria bacterium]